LCRLFLYPFMKILNDITKFEDIKLLVDTFYSQVQKDDLIGPIFNGKIGNKWPEHLEKMYRFWQTILLEEHTYSGSPFPPHKQLPVAKKHFDRWMEILLRQQTSYLLEPLRKKLNYAPRIWQKCSITKLTILEMLDKMAIF
jgi:hemoglobin